jgi:glutaredoxin domain-containing cysteine-rich protein 1
VGKYIHSLNGGGRPPDAASVKPIPVEKKTTTAKKKKSSFVKRLFRASVSHSSQGHGRPKTTASSYELALQELANGDDDDDDDDEASLGRSPLGESPTAAVVDPIWNPGPARAAYERALQELDAEFEQNTADVERADRLGVIEHRIDVTSGASPGNSEQAAIKSQARSDQPRIESPARSEQPRIESRARSEQAGIESPARFGNPGIESRAIEADSPTQRKPKPPAEDPLARFVELCPPAGEGAVVLYTTSLRGIRKTFEDCNALRQVLESLLVRIDERDVALHEGFRNELRELMQRPPLTSLPTSVPKLFIGGRYIGGAEEVLQLHEEQKLLPLLDKMPRQRSTGGPCDGCGGVRFIPCLDCSGSRKLIDPRSQDMIRCPECNENGLIRCPICN